MQTEELESTLGAWCNVLPSSSIETANRLAAKAIAESQHGHIIHPEPDCGHIFRALNLTQPEQVRVVILGQDPYHEPGQATGLAFSVNEGCALPRSLQNIFKELHTDIGCPIPSSGELTPWAKQGVLLLNTVLTVENKFANSHASWGWQAFTTEVIRATAKLPQPIVYILWGGQARAACAEMPLFESGENKATLWSNHPSPLSASRPPVPFFGSRPFSTANMILKTYGSAPIDWELE